MIKTKNPRIRGGDFSTRFSGSENSTIVSQDERGTPFGAEKIVVLKSNHPAATGRKLHLNILVDV